jgi:hypothetical protein
MVRNWDAIRSILLRLEQAESANAFLNATQFPELPEQEAAYHLWLLNDGGFIEAQTKESGTGDGKIAFALAKRLTWKGHELLDSIRNESVWTKVKEAFRSKGIGMTFDLVLDLAKKIAAGAIGLG